MCFTGREDSVTRLTKNDTFFPFTLKLSTRMIDVKYDQLTLYTPLPLNTN